MAFPVCPQRALGFAHQLTKRVHLCKLEIIPKAKFSVLLAHVNLVCIARWQNNSRKIKGVILEREEQNTVRKNIICFTAYSRQTFISNLSCICG